VANGTIVNNPMPPILPPGDNYLVNQLPLITGSLEPDYQLADVGYTPDHLQNPYLAQELSVAYFGDEGLLQVPVGAPFPAGSAQVPCKIVRTHAPVMEKVVTYGYARMGLPPLIPPPETDDPNLRLMEHVRLFSGAQEIMPGVMLYFRVGEYRYAVITPLTTQDRMPVADNPAWNVGTGVDEVNLSDYSTAILPS